MDLADFFPWYATYISPVVQIGIIYALLYYLLRGLARISAAVKLKGLAVAIVAVVLAAVLGALGPVLCVELVA